MLRKKSILMFYLNSFQLIYNVRKYLHQKLKINVTSKHLFDLVTFSPFLSFCKKAKHKKNARCCYVISIYEIKVVLRFQNENKS